MGPSNRSKPAPGKGRKGLELSLGTFQKDDKRQGLPSSVCPQPRSFWSPLPPTPSPYNRKSLCDVGSQGMCRPESKPSSEAL